MTRSCIRLLRICDSLMQLRVIENDIVEALEYLESCQECAPTFTTGECRKCDHQGHERGVTPELFAGLSGGSALAPTGPLVVEAASACGGLVGLRGARHESLPADMDDLSDIEELDLGGEPKDENREDRN